MTISLGEQGTQVFARGGNWGARSWLFSASSPTPAAPVWSDQSPGWSFHHRQASAQGADLHAELEQVETAGAGSLRRAILRVYRSGSSEPQWTHTFAPLLPSHPHLAVRFSADGRRLVTVVFEPSAFTHWITVFDPASAAPLGVGTIVNLNPFKTVDLSADGRTLVVATSLRLVVMDLDSLQLVHTQYYGADTFDGAAAVSGDGSRFAYGTLGAAKIFVRTGSGGYALDFVHPEPQGGLCRTMDFSADGSTLALGFRYFSPLVQARIVAVDVASRAETMNHLAVGAGTLTLLPYDISIADDGSRFAVALWGDEAGLVPELLVFRRDRSLPIHAHDLPGSAFDVDMSADGKRVALASKAVHANLPTGGGRIDLFAIGEEDLVLQGVPSHGASVRFRQWIRPGDLGVLLRSPQRQDPPMYLGGMGWLHLDRNSVQLSPPGTADSQGRHDTLFQVPAGTQWIGESLYFQGFSLSERKLGQDWIKMTILP